MSNIINLVRRADDAPITPAMYKLLVALMVLFIVALLLVAGLLVMRRRRRNSTTSELPLYNNDKRASTSSTSSHHRRNRARPSHSIHIYHDKPDLDEKNSRPSTPGSPVPEIRITFPEEFDDSGKRQSGRVVVVHVGDNGGVGMSPVDEKLPAHEVGESRMQSVDLERVGGLVEKARNKPLGW